jgi:hypothetical protein
MRDQNEPTSSERSYAAAYAAHYSERNLAAPLRLYMDLIASRPNAREAGYSRAQTQDIVNAVVPAQALFDAQIGLAVARLDCRESS